MCFVAFIFLILPYSIQSLLTCNEVLEMPDEKKINLYELKEMTPKDIVECLAHLSRNKLEMFEAEYIWDAVIEYHEGISNIPEEVLVSLHWVTVAIKPDDYGNLTLSNIDVITNFGLDYNLNSAQLSAIADRVREDFGSKEPEDYTVYDLSALRQILCAFNKSEIERIHPAAYKEAAVLLGKMRPCTSEIMEGFADLAIQKKAFGPSNLWSNATIDALGHVAEYLPKDVIAKVKDKKDE